LSLACAGVVFALLASRAGPRGEVICGVAAFVLLMLLVAALSERLRRRWAPRSFAGDRLGPRTLTISSADVANMEAACESFSTWKVFGDVEHDERFIVFYLVRPLIGYLIPKSAFGSPDEAERFAQLAERCCEKANPGASAALATANPYQPPTVI
jgi:hypothetical protein